MSLVRINPRYERLLAAHGLLRAEDFLQLPGLVVSGHSYRHVARVELGTDLPVKISAYLKREHQVRWRDRWASARAGFGFVSKSQREAMVLITMAARGVACPEWLAWGEDGRGRAFLLVRELSGAIDLRLWLARHPCGADRRRLAQAIGEAIAQLHRAGYRHASLEAKHLLVGGRTPPQPGTHPPGGRRNGTRVWFLDWQRARRLGSYCWRDLATLDATLSGDLVSDRERYACLRAYLRAAGGANEPLRRAARLIRDSARGALQSRRIREQREITQSVPAAGLVWAEGEAVCLTKAFHEACAGEIPGWLQAARKRVRQQGGVFRQTAALPDGKRGVLICRRGQRPLAWLWSWLRGRRLSSPELEQAAALLRLERFGVPGPKLLAFGHDERRWGAWESFLLYEALPRSVDLRGWLLHANGARRQQRSRLFQHLGDTLRRIHQARYLVGRRRHGVLGVSAHGGPAVHLEHASALRPLRRVGHREAITTSQYLRGAGASRTERLRFARAYLGDTISPGARDRLLRRLVTVRDPLGPLQIVKLIRRAWVGARGVLRRGEAGCPAAPARNAVMGPLSEVG